jgi:hypothetical protein
VVPWLLPAAPSVAPLLLGLLLPQPQMGQGHRRLLLLLLPVAVEALAPAAELLETLTLTWCELALLPPPCCTPYQLCCC